ncbi:winged helix-turn-helix transcriptional regulator [Agromyces aurantiacus]|uniref:Winged helix-turn-helix transcriptional regulator n=1 Tax=Agromyces aurantiacus TaxID=165814 RepID=A0ABV9R7M3_9MICO|nr:helix-turn-helix domain-containing protein [Agromyces aurantiacus]MBM7505109.1 DNA-binding HxlR family transcriptional regulator/putative sterol carrier protein [Agromyces aurantiacus]
MSSRKFADACGIARSLDVIGERWALLVVRELVFGPKRFTDLRNGLNGISQNVLSQRLRDLEAADVVRRTTLGPPASTKAYELTPAGQALEPVLIAMSRWGARTPVEPGTRMSDDAFALALKALFVASADAAFTGRVRLRLGHDAFDAEVGSSEIAVARASGPDPDLVLIGDESSLRSVMFHDETLAAARARGTIEVHGDADRAAQFLARFGLPTDDPVAQR